MTWRSIIYLSATLLATVAVFTSRLIDLTRENDSLRAHVRLLVETCDGR